MVSFQSANQNLLTSSNISNNIYVSKVFLMEFNEMIGASRISLPIFVLKNCLCRLSLTLLNGDLIRLDD